MAIKLSTDEWIKRAKANHGERYDYSLVDYKNRDSKVKIICAVHGVFEQIAGNHTKGKGCPKCAPNARMTLSSFIKKANEKHNNKYDYSETKFTRNRDKVIIKCGEHGAFEQEANSHIQGSGCPECANAIRSIAVTNHPTRVDGIKKTVRERYGVDNVMYVDAFKDKLVNTVRDRYGVDNYTQTDEYRDKYKTSMLAKYGVSHYSQTDEFRDKNEITLLKRYGVPNYAQSEEYQSRLPEILKKSEITQLKKYGAKHYSQSESFREALPVMIERNNETKRKNNTFNTSKPEEFMYQSLYNTFGADVVRQYKDSRYPFMCDFYIKSRDLFIELNAAWTHGKHWYGSDGMMDEDLVESWQNKNSPYYDNAIQTWTVRDVRKREMARDNKLNYVVFWDADLLDFYMWVDEGMPDAKDYDKEYSWIID
ncbi:DUF7487 domain-containing protein [Evansella clarkii]|uniref:DUF7487 domain-containing protein n=1 Tax=Evansella clarkii TaxID=79879 RepID=UPI000998B94C|nr:hypothetical protein [Evansella clarkii]